MEMLLNLKRICSGLTKNIIMNLDGKVLQGEETEQKTKYWPQCIAHTYICAMCILYMYATEIFLQRERQPYSGRSPPNLFTSSGQMTQKPKYIVYQR